VSKVLVRTGSYDLPTVRPKVSGILEAFLGEEDLRGRRVLLKPNFLSPAAPEEALLTHPLVVRAVAEHVLEAGGKVRISDSPATGSFDRILKQGGYAEALKGLPVVFEEFGTSVPVDIGEPFGRIEMAREVFDADLVINLPKWKTHSQMVLTLGVKNLFGCIVGFRKPEWHMRTGVDQALFARLLVQVCRAVNPAVTLLDGILALEGEGPGRGGVPRGLGVLMGSDDPVAVDRAVCAALGLPPEDLPTNRAAAALGLAGEEVDIDGELPRIADFLLPPSTPVVYGPRAFQRLVRSWLLQKPAVRQDRCNGCDACLEYCPANAIQRENEGLRFDYDRCIRCFCCIEVCPKGALRIAESLPGKMLRKAIRRK
jgi:uncharacterized protein (DUF362 family)/Pyruvate/2-oxoacid:ferredoxin oxidoreductase delta subunit